MSYFYSVIRKAYQKKEHESCFNNYGLYLMISSDDILSHGMGLKGFPTTMELDGNFN